MGRRCAVSWEIAANSFVNYTFPHTLATTFHSNEGTQRKKDQILTRHKILASALSSQSATILGSFREIQISFLQPTATAWEECVSFESCIIRTLLLRQFFMPAPSNLVTNWFRKELASPRQTFCVFTYATQKLTERMRTRMKRDHHLTLESVFYANRSCLPRTRNSWISWYAEEFLPNHIIGRSRRYRTTNIIFEHMFEY